MSQSTKQSLTLIAVVNAGLRASLQCFDMGNEFRCLLESARASTERAVVKWPISGCRDAKRAEMAHKAFIERALSEWQDKMQPYAGRFNLMTNLSVSLQILDDLYQITRDRQKKAMLDGLFAPILACHDWLHERGDRFDDYDFAYQMISELYKIIGFGGPIRRAA